MRAVKIWETFCAAETFALGKTLGEQAKPGDIYCLEGDLGVGKTVFTQGFAAGLGIKGPVNSPTFTIVQEYRQGRLPLFHFDVYRISDPDEMLDVGLEEYLYAGEGVCLIEWPSRIEELLPPEARWLHIEKDLSRGLDYRKIWTSDGEEGERT